MENKNDNYKTTYTGERAQYFAENKAYESALFCEGESPLKHATDVKLKDSAFQWKYPLWNSENINVEDTVFLEMGKAGIWYTNNITLRNCEIKAPKEFRRSKNITLENVDFSNALETFWNCSDVKLKNVKARGDYFAMNTQGFRAENFTLDGNYFLDGGKNIEIYDSVINSKDAFWNCENVTVYNSRICGEYLGWYSRNLKFVNCIIESNQGLCYVEGLTLVDCRFEKTTLAFEYSSGIDAKVDSYIESVKNPLSGKICAKEIGTLILNPKRTKIADVVIECSRVGQTFSEDPNDNENEF